MSDLSEEYGYDGGDEDDEDRGNGERGPRPAGRAAHAAHTPSSADSAIAMFQSIDKKVDAMREQRINDPDSLGDKLLKIALPAITGLVAGQVFQMLWNRGTAKRKAANGGEDGLMMTLLFSALSAAFGAVVTQLSDRGSKAFVDRRHRKHGRG